MKLKLLAKRLVPQGARRIVNRAREYRNGVRGGYVWEGIYASFKEVPATGGGFDGNIWIEARRRNFEARLAAGKRGQAELFADENVLLPYLVSIVGAQHGSVRILDFGGGLGESYLDICAALGQTYSIDYHVIETPPMCAKGNSLFAGDSQIQFHEALPSELATPDVVYVSSALQYVEDYTATIKQLCAYRAPYVLFVKLSAGNIPTYVTAQKNLAGSTMPYRFINMQELVELMGAEGYVLISQSLISREYDQSNFPEKYRFKHACNLLFVRRDCTELGRN